VTDPHPVNVDSVLIQVECSVCAAGVPVRSWWRHRDWHRTQRDVMRVVAAEAMLDALEAKRAQVAAEAAS